MPKLSNKFNITMPAMYGFPKNSATVVYDPANFRYIVKDESGKIAKLGEKDLLAKIENGEYVIDEYKMPDLSETYRRYFGEIPKEDRSGRNLISPSESKKLITESQMKTWLNLHRTFKTQFPNRNLAMTEGLIKLDSHVVESAEKFLKRDLGSMVEVLRNASRSIK